MPKTALVIGKKICHKSCQNHSPKVGQFPQGKAHYLASAPGTFQATHSTPRTLLLCMERDTGWRRSTPWELQPHCLQKWGGPPSTWPDRDHHVKFFKKLVDEWQGANVHVYTHTQSEVATQRPLTFQPYNAFPFSSKTGLEQMHTEHEVPCSGRSWVVMSQVWIFLGRNTTVKCWSVCLPAPNL